MGVLSCEGEVTYWRTPWKERKSFCFLNTRQKWVTVGSDEGANYVNKKSKTNCFISAWGAVREEWEVHTRCWVGRRLGLSTSPAFLGSTRM
jgi:hypothetical protein